MPWLYNTWRGILRRPYPYLVRLSPLCRNMSSTSLAFPIFPPLPSRYRIRHVTTADRSACIRLIAHSFMYHNNVDVVHREPSAVYLPIAALVFDHCIQHTQHLCFLITDTQHTTTNTADTSHIVDHDADRTSLDDTDTAACILNYDAAHSPDLDSLRSNAVYSRARLAVDFTLFNTLYQSPDLRTNPPPPPHPTSAGHTVDCFFLAVKCDQVGRGLARYLCRVLYSEAARLGYRELETSATHPATARIFLHQLADGVEGVVTRRLKPSEVVVKREDGSEERPWADVKDDVVCVSVTIEAERSEQATQPILNT